MRLGLDKYPYAEVESNEGDIIKIDSKGNLTKTAFHPADQYTLDWYDYRPDSSTCRRLTQLASRCGVHWEYIYMLLDYGYLPVEIEDMLGISGAVETTVNDIMCEYGWCEC